MNYTEKAKAFNEFVESRLVAIKSEYIKEFMNSANREGFHISLEIVVDNKPLIKYIK